MTGAQAKAADAADGADFTFERFAKLCRIMRDQYEVLRFADLPDRPGILWRHDVDISLRKALRIAQIEAEQGVHATYYFLPHSEYHNLAAREELDLARRIVALGHDAGLHFDPEFYDPALPTAEYEHLASAERDWLSTMLHVEVKSISLHNLGILHAAPQADRLAGMVNANSRRLRDSYRYISDSHGVWQFENLFDVVKSHRYDRLQALTHPVWWSEHPLPARTRLQECIDETAHALARSYDAFVDRHADAELRERQQETPS